jgi:hypothetical protein
MIGKQSGSGFVIVIGAACTILYICDILSLPLFFDNIGFAYPLHHILYSTGCPRGFEFR